ncbi:MAG: iron ABC transporter permease [Oscillospiraceae bacterium]|nr:iron ABC transporter permease [Oscillospiraceae bacterium]
MIEVLKNKRAERKARKEGISLLRAGLVWTVLVAVLVFLMLTAIAIGSVRYPLALVLRALFGLEEGTVSVIVLNLRLPRVLLAMLLGAALATSGSLLQAVMRNPLADPGIIGVSAGAATAATTILLLFPALALSVPLFAFIGAGLACLLIYSMAWKGGVDPIRLILTGVAINAVLGGYTGLLQLMYSDNLASVLAFMNGNLSGRSWVHVQTVVVYCIIGLGASLFCIKSANALQLGDEMCKNLGVRVNLNRIVLSAVSAFLAAATVSVVGLIGFVGLVVPRVARMLVGSDYRVMLPTSMLLGAAVLLFADTVGRSIVPGMEIPVGIVMAVIGGPAFLYMLRKRGRFSGT